LLAFLKVYSGPLRLCSFVFLEEIYLCNEDFTQPQECFGIYAKQSFTTVAVGSFPCVSREILCCFFGIG